MASAFVDSSFLTWGKLQDAVIVYARPEDEFYHKHCSWSCTFPITTREVEKDELHPLRMVLGITSQQAVSARCDTDFAEVILECWYSNPVCYATAGKRWSKLSATQPLEHKFSIET